MMGPVPPPVDDVFRCPKCPCQWHGLKCRGYSYNNPDKQRQPCDCPTSLYRLPEQEAS